MIMQNSFYHTLRHETSFPQLENTSKFNNDENISRHAMLCTLHLSLQHLIDTKSPSFPWAS
jgi:hypothetical protein